MKMSQLLNQTRRETPADAEAAGHQFLLRAGYVRQLAAGIFNYLHLGQRALQKLEAIMRAEMDSLGGQEIKMPLVHPAAVWQESGRWYEIDAELGRLQDRNGRSLVLALSHEEIVTELAWQEIQSYRQLPRLVYHIQLKWRDDPRPRAGLIRAREFTMLDSYSLDVDKAGLDGQYAAHMAAYERIFRRCGLPVTAVEADVGMMGGYLAHEYMFLTPIGEDTLLLCDQCGYQANRQVARFRRREASAATTTHSFMAEMMSGQETVRRPVAAVLAQGREVNETKLVNALDAQRVQPAQFDAAQAAIWVVDETVAEIIVPERSKITAEIGAARAGDRCLHCGRALRAERAVEVANIFKLGTRFTQAMNVTFVDEKGETQPIVMGSYGIGVTRLLACLAEHHHDERGLVWPHPIAPYGVHLVALHGGVGTAESLYRQLKSAGVEVLFDDRDEQPGVKFNDADLIGCPLRLTVSRRSLAQGGVELKQRSEDGTAIVSLETAVAHVCERLAAV